MKVLSVEFCNYERICMTVTRKTPGILQIVSKIDEFLEHDQNWHPVLISFF